jgi:hypothetical protein
MSGCEGANAIASVRYETAASVPAEGDGVRDRDSGFRVRGGEFRDRGGEFRLT